MWKSFRRGLAESVVENSRWALWVCAVLGATPVAALMGAADAVWLPAAVQTGLRATASAEYLLFVMLIYAAVVHVRDSAIEAVRGMDGQSVERGLNASDTGWVFWAIGASVASLSTVLSMAPQNIEQQIFSYGDEVVWSGAISRKAPDVEALFSGEARVLRLLNNRGGDLSVARRVADSLDRLGVTRVIADGQCASSCAHLWLLSEGRELAPYSVIGLHRGMGTRRTLRKQVIDEDVTRSINDELVDALVGAGVERAKAEELMAASGNKMNWLSASDLAEAGVSFVSDSVH